MLDFMIQYLLDRRDARDKHANPALAKAKAEVVELRLQVQKSFIDNVTALRAELERLQAENAQLRSVARWSGSALAWARKEVAALRARVRDLNDPTFAAARKEVAELRARARELNG